MDASNKAVHISVNESVSEVNEGLLFESASENMQFGDRLAEHPLLITYVLACKEDYRMIRVSSTIARLGYSPESWFDHSNFRLTLVHEEDSERISRALQHSVHTGDKFNCCYRLYDSSGQVNWFHDMASVTFDDRGMPLLLKGVMLDITDKKSLETELYEHRYYIERKVEIKTEQLMKRMALLESCNEALCEKLELAQVALAGLACPAVRTYPVTHPQQENVYDAHGVGDWVRNVFGCRVAAAGLIA